MMIAGLLSDDMALDRSQAGHRSQLIAMVNRGLFATFSRGLQVVFDEGKISLDCFLMRISVPRSRSVDYSFVSFLREIKLSRSLPTSRKRGALLRLLHSGIDRSSGQCLELRLRGRSGRNRHLLRLKRSASFLTGDFGITTV